MSLLQRLEMRQGQALVMTPQLLQAIKLLQLSQLDLAAYVDAELERNPLLERAEGEAEIERAPAETPSESSVDRDGEGGDYDGRRYLRSASVAAAVLAAVQASPDAHLTDLVLRPTGR